MKHTILALLAVAAVFLTSMFGCDRGTLRVLSGSENKTLEPILERFAREKRVKLDMAYKGSVDIMLELQQSDAPYDVVWPASGFWIELGDTAKRVRHAKPVMLSPVAWGIRKGLAQELGLVGKKDVAVRDLLAHVQSGKLKFLMTSATQSNSGAAAYLGLLSALAGSPATLTSADLQKPELKAELKALFKGVQRSAGSSGWLADLFLEGTYDAMVNYESVLIETNQKLEAAGREPLYIVYPVDGLVMADSPLAYVSGVDPKKEELFKELQAFMLDAKTQKDLLALGRRTGFGGSLKDADRAVFNPDWGIDKDRILTTVNMPAGSFVMEALALYQSTVRKPSYTTFCLDFSGSMDGDGERQLKDAMRRLLDQKESERFMLQTTREDRIAILPFSDRLYPKIDVRTADPTDLERAAAHVMSMTPGGGTDIYRCVEAAVTEMAADPQLADWAPAVIVMSDGESNGERTFGDVSTLWRSNGRDIPVFSILFGKASRDQLDEVAKLTRGRVFDGDKDLVSAFRQAKGYN